LGAFWDRFYQQKVRGWAPRPGFRATLLFFGALCAVSAILGAVFLWSTLRQVDEQRRYDNIGPFAGLSDDQRSNLLRSAGACHLSPRALAAAMRTFTF